MVKQQPGGIRIGIGNRCPVKRRVVAVAAGEVPNNRLFTLEVTFVGQCSQQEVAGVGGVAIFW